jgi:hypothetical protein
MADEKPPVETVQAVDSGSAASPEPSVLGTAPVEAKIETPVEAPVEVKAETPVETKTEEVKTETPAEDKPVEKPIEAKTDEKPKSEEKPVETPKSTELPKFEALLLPEGVKLEDAQVKDIDSMFGNFALSSKAPVAEVQKLRQAMVDYGLGVIKDSVAKVHADAQKYWETKTKEYREAFKSDLDIGGAKMEATTEAARQFIAQHAGSPEKADEVRKVLQDHKLDNHPAIIRLLANANLARREGKPIPAQKSVPAKVGKLDRWYGSMKE